MFGINKNGTKHKFGIVMPSFFPSSRVTYDNTQSGLTSTDVQDAIDELVQSGGGSIDIQRPTFTEASTRANIESGETISTLFGKIKKWFTDLPSMFVSKSGDTMTGHLGIQRAGEAYVNVKNTNTGCIAYLDSDTNGDHGVWSHGYWNGSSYTASGRWILRRTTDGRAAIDVATVIGKNNTTDTPLVVNRSNSGTVWIDFQNGGSEIGAFGVSAAKKPLFYDTSTHVLSMRTVTTLVDETANIAAGGNKTYATLTPTALAAYDEIHLYAEYGNVASNGSATKAQIEAAASYGGGATARINFLGYVLEVNGTISTTYSFGIRPRSTGLQVFNLSLNSTIGRLLIEGITY